MAFKGVWGEAGLEAERGVGRCCPGVLGADGLRCRPGAAFGGLRASVCVPRRQDWKKGARMKD